MIHNLRDASGRFVKKPTTKTKKVKKPTNVKKNIVNHVVLLLDTSGSMAQFSNLAERTNKVIEQYSSLPSDQKTYLEVITFDDNINTIIEKHVVDQKNPRRINNYPIRGNTRLLDAINYGINSLSKVSTTASEDEAFLLIGLTDGEENMSRDVTIGSLAERVSNLTETGKWTFAFCGPDRLATMLRKLNLRTGNIFTWEQNQRGYEIATQSLGSTATSYSAARSAGRSSSSTLFADTDHLNTKVLNAIAADVTNQYKVWNVIRKTDISDFVKNKGYNYEKSEARAFYELTKTEDVQHYKNICIMDRVNGKIYSGSIARKLLGLPEDNYTTVKVKPGNGNYRIFVSSTSSNRILLPNTTLLYRF